MRAGMAALAGLCVAIGLVPGLIVPTLAGLAPGGGGELHRHAGLAIPGTGSYPALALAVALVALFVVLRRARGERSAAPAPSWACGQSVVPALSWTSAGFSKPLRLAFESVLRPRTEIDVVEDGGLGTQVA